MDNIKIGDGAVIRAASVITKNMPAYAVVIGVNKLCIVKKLLINYCKYRSEIGKTIK